MRTIFIPIFQGVEARNILRTDIFKILKNQKDPRIVLFVSNKQKEEYFKKEFYGENIFYEVFDKYKKPSANGLFTFLKFILIKTKTMDMRRKVQLAEDRNFLSYYFRTIFNRIFARRIWRKLVRWLDYKFVRDENFVEIFEKYQPDLVFLAHLFGDEETSILRQAKKRKIKSIGLINSWDKITSRCMIRLLPQKLIVHSPTVKKEAIQHVDMDIKDIEIVGIPHYDVFFNSLSSPKEKFYKKIGCDINKRLLVFCPLGKSYSDIDFEIINLISDAQIKNLIPADVQIMVRYPPNDIVDEGGFKNRDKLIIIQPGIRFTAQTARLGSTMSRRVDWDMGDADIQLLLDTLFYASLIVCHSSTIVIDAAIFDKPVINYNLKSRMPVVVVGDPSWMYELTHSDYIKRTGASRMVETEQKLIKWINKYLKEPELDRENRKKLMMEQCWKFDGRSGERTANFILDFLRQ